jgi:hypothetical protein
MYVKHIIMKIDYIYRVYALDVVFKMVPNVYSNFKNKHMHLYSS